MMPSPKTSTGSFGSLVARSVAAALALILVAGAAPAGASVIYQFSTLDSSPPNDDGYVASAVSINMISNVTAPADGTALAAGNVGLTRFWNSEWAGFDTSCANGTAIDSAAEFATGYWTLTVTANAGYQLDLTSLDYDIARGGTAGTRLYMLFAEVDGGVFAFGDTPIDASPGGNETGLRTSPRPVSVDLTGAAYQGIDSITFRFYPLTDSTTRTMGFDGWTLSGTVVPEPGSAFLLAAGAGWLLRRRKAKA